MRYLAQTFCHSLVVALVVEALISIWHIEAPRGKIRFRVLALALPVLSFPVFQLLHPGRGEVAFRAQFALLDVGKWLRLPLAKGVTLGSVLFWFFMAISAVFVLEELLPALQHFLRCHKRDLERVSPESYPELHAVTSEIAGHFGDAAPVLQKVEDEAPLLCFAGIRRHALIFSQPLLTLLEPLELKAVLAHEMAHLVRRENRWNLWLLLLRLAMFYNPVAMLVFQRILKEKEKLCDDWAAAATGLPNHLASGLLKVFRASEAVRLLPVHFWLASKVDALESHSRRTVIEERLQRILYSQPSAAVSYLGLRLSLVAVGVSVLLFFVV